MRSRVFAIAAPGMTALSEQALGQQPESMGMHPVDSGNGPAAITSGLFSPDSLCMMDDLYSKVANFRFHPIKRALMNHPAQIAKHLYEIYFGGNWTTSCLKDALAGITWQQATTQVHGFNTIAALVYHTHYYVAAVTQVLQGHPLQASDKLSFDHPPIQSADDWEQLLAKVWADAATFANLIEQMPEDRLGTDFTDPKYGSYYRNLHGIIEHLHYHLGQIVLIRRLVEQQ